MTVFAIVMTKNRERKALLAKNMAYKYRLLRYLCNKAAYSLTIPENRLNETMVPVNGR